MTRTDFPRSENDKWLPDFILTGQEKLYALLAFQGCGQDIRGNVAYARKHIALVLERVQQWPTELYHRRGLFRKYYWVWDTYPVFLDDRDEYYRSIHII